MVDVFILIISRFIKNTISAQICIIFYKKGVYYESFI
nr:MAG TPA: hypothetical protein [Caudoviricetes sp.]